MSSTLSTLRSKHPTLRYRGYTLQRDGPDVRVTFMIELDPAISFRPTLSFAAGNIDEGVLEPYLFNLGMVELISYWKTACPPAVVLEDYKLSPYQEAWWRDLFIHGLGEFFFRNDVDPSAPDLLRFEYGKDTPASWSIPLPASPSEGELVLAAGGKDSSLTLELLKRIAPSVRREVLILNPTRSAHESVSVAGYEQPIIVRRTIDRNLIALNNQGYLNGHTPFSAYLAFLSLMIARIRGLKATVVSNERSASEENAIFHGLAVNHQYSKGLRFERRFREYASRELPGSASYYSLLRPLYDLQVSRLFALHAQNHLSSFRSCNVGQKEDRWCNRCPKCAFVCLTLAPFLSLEQRTRIFGEDPFLAPEILQAIKELTGVQDHKPFECVGTISESRDALVLTLQRYIQAGNEPPVGLHDIAASLARANSLPSAGEATSTLSAWSEDHELPPHYAATLQKLISEGLS